MGDNYSDYTMALALDLYASEVGCGSFLNDGMKKETMGELKV